MPEEVKKEEVKKEEPKKKGPFGKLKEKAEDSEEQLAIVSTFVRLGILVWSGGILTLNYVTIPNFPQGKIDPTFMPPCLHRRFTTFGVQTAKNKNGNGGGGASGGVSKADMEKLIAAASQTAPAQTIRIEQAPLQIGNPPAPQGPAKSDDTYKL